MSSEKYFEFSSQYKKKEIALFKVNDSDTIVQEKWRKIVNKRPCPATMPKRKAYCASNVAFLEIPHYMRNNFLKNYPCKTTVLKRKYFLVDICILVKKGLGTRMETEINRE